MDGGKAGDRAEHQPAVGKVSRRVPAVVPDAAGGVALLTGRAVLVIVTRRGRGRLVPVTLTLTAVVGHLLLGVAVRSALLCFQP